MALQSFQTSQSAHPHPSSVGYRSAPATQGWAEGIWGPPAGSPPQAPMERAPPRAPVAPSHNNQAASAASKRRGRDRSAEIAASWWAEVRATSKGQVQTILSCLGESRAVQERRAGGGLSTFIGHR